MNATDKTVPAAPGRRLEINRLRERLEELEETLRAIRTGEVDALIVAGSEGDQVFTLQGAEHPYRVLVESMNEGAATVNWAGDILYANRRLAEMLATPLEQLISSSLRDVVRNFDLTILDSCLNLARKSPQKLACDLHTGMGELLPVNLSLSPMQQNDFHGICLIATDLTQHKLREAQLALEVGQRKRAEEALQQEEQSLRELSGRLLRLQDDERRRIARDLHDTTGQKVVALTLELSMIEAKLGHITPELATILQECRNLADEVSTDIRTLSYVLHPPLLDEAGLASAARWFVDGFARRSKIQVNLDLPAELERMPQELELTMFRILQESLTNVHRHANSPNAFVRISRQEDAITLEVKDEGRVAKPSVVSASEKNVELLGVGVRGMRERVRQLGGHLELRSGPEGTVIRATMPLAQSSRA